jgi:hypothetical protein
MNATTSLILQEDAPRPACKRAGLGGDLAAYSTA